MPTSSEASSTQNSFMTQKKVSAPTKKAGKKPANYLELPKQVEAKGVFKKNVLRKNKSITRQQLDQQQTIKTATSPLDDKHCTTTISKQPINSARISTAKSTSRPRSSTYQVGAHKQKAIAMNLRG